MLTIQSFLLSFDSPELLQMGTHIVESSLLVMKALATSLLPSTTNRAHYHFGFGDLVHVVEGMLMYSPGAKSESLPKVLLLKYVPYYFSNYILIIVQVVETRND